jgi:hypothetical protein
VKGTRADAEALKAEIAGVLTGMGLRLSPEKTLIIHIDEGLDFLGWRIQRHYKKGQDRQYVYTYPAKKALRAICQKVKDVCRTTSINLPLSVLLRRLNPALRGLVRLLPARGVQRDLQLPRRHHLAAGHGLAAPQTPPDHLEGPAPPLLRRRMAAC